MNEYFKNEKKIYDKNININGRPVHFYYNILNM